MTIPFATQQNQLFNIKLIEETMLDVGLDPQFVKAACDLASIDQGVYELLDGWSRARNEQEEVDIIKDLEASIKDYNKLHPYWRLDFKP